MALQALGYVGISSTDLEGWASYATRFLGMQLVDKSRTMLSLRMDDRKQRVIVNSDNDAASFYGWEVADATALDALGAGLERAGGKIARGSRALAGERRGEDGTGFPPPLRHRGPGFFRARGAKRDRPPRRPAVGLPPRP